MGCIQFLKKMTRMPNSKLPADSMQAATSASTLAWWAKRQALSTDSHTAGAGATATALANKGTGIRQLFSIPKHLFQIRNVIPTLEFYIKKTSGDSKNAFLHCGDVLRIRARWVVCHLSKQISRLLSSMTHIVTQLLLLP